MHCQCLAQGPELDDTFYFPTNLLAGFLDLNKGLLTPSKSTLNLYINHIKFYSNSDGRKKLWNLPKWCLWVPHLTSFMNRPPPAFLILPSRADGQLVWNPDITKLEIPKRFHSRFFNFKVTHLCTFCRKRKISIPGLLLILDICG